MGGKEEKMRREMVGRGEGGQSEDDETSGQVDIITLL